MFELLSLVGHMFGIINTISFLAITLVVLAISVWKIHYAFWIVCVELFIGSFGYQLFLDVGDYRLSIRLALFIALFLGWIIYTLRAKRIPFPNRKDPG